MMNPGMFFIVGRGRSGTDLLSSMLDTHSNISVPPEALFIMDLKSTYKHVKKWTKEEKGNFYSDLWYEKRLKNWWKLDQKKLKKDIMEQPADTEFQELCKLVYMNEAVETGNEEVKMIGDKNPTYTLFMDELSGLFTRAKFVHLVRDYRDNILSFQKVGFDLNSTTALAQRWVEYNEAVLEFSSENPGKVLTIRFEDLLAAPRETLSEICAFLKLEFKEEMLQFYKTKENYDEWQNNLQKPLDQKQMKKWKSKMKKKDRKIAELICGETGEKFDYPREFTKGNFPLQVRVLPGRMVGKTANFVEKNFFRIPLKARVFILEKYRKISGTNTKRV